MSKNLDQILITKSTGERVLFEASKLTRSLERSGANTQLITDILNKINIYEGVTTKAIYKQAFSFLKKSSRPSAARYKLKKAIQELGPSGYPFEQFIGEILKYQGYKVEVGVIVKGHCVNHEVDIIAENKTKHFMIECKFHSNSGRFCHVKVPLYIQSRFLDVERNWKLKPGHQKKAHQGWIFTNTRFTSDAIQYGNCIGLKLVGWDYPKKDSLKEQIDVSGLHPITCLTLLKKAEKQDLLDNKIVLCMEICQTPQLLEDIGIDKRRKNKILREAHQLCNMNEE